MSTLTPVTGSSNVKAVGYDEANKRLTVQFATGTYDYHEVPTEKWAAIQEAMSKGDSVGRVVSSQIVKQHKYAKREEAAHGG